MSVIKRTLWSIGGGVALVILGFIINLYFTLSGGVPWIKPQVQARMVQLLKAKYPNHPFQVVSNAFLDFKDNHWSIGIVFNSEPSTEFGYELNFSNKGGSAYSFHSSSSDTITSFFVGPAPNADRKEWISKYNNNIPQPPAN